MSCIDLELPPPFNPIPTIPDIFLGLPALVVEFPPPIPGIPCCHFKLAVPGLDELIATVNLATSLACLALSAALMPEIIAVNEVIAIAQTQVNKVRLRIPDCPCNGATIG